MSISEKQVRDAIQVLHAYVDEKLQLDDELAAELEQAIEAAGNKQMENIICDIEPEPSEPPLTASW